MQHMDPIEGIRDKLRRHPELRHRTRENWCKGLRVLCLTVFVLSFSVAVAHLTLELVFLSHGASDATSTQTVPIDSHGELVWVTPVQKQLLDVLLVLMIWGLFISVALALLATFLKPRSA